MEGLGAPTTIKIENESSTKDLLGLITLELSALSENPYSTFSQVGGLALHEVKKYFGLADTFQSYGTPINEEERLCLQAIEKDCREALGCASKLMDIVRNAAIAEQNGIEEPTISYEDFLTTFTTKELKDKTIFGDTNIKFKNIKEFLCVRTLFENSLKLSSTIFLDQKTTATGDNLFMVGDNAPTTSEFAIKYCNSAEAAYLEGLQEGTNPITRNKGGGVIAAEIVGQEKGLFKFVHSEKGLKGVLLRFRASQPQAFAMAA